MNGNKWTAGVIVIGTKVYNGQREDKSGAVIQSILNRYGFDVAKTVILPGEEEEIKKELTAMADELGINLIITHGCTGYSPTDVTPEATRAVIEREAPGISEAMRAFSLSLTPNAMLARGVSGIRGKTLIVNMSGNSAIVKEVMEYVIGPLGSALKALGEEKAEAVVK